MKPRRLLLLVAGSPLAITAFLIYGWFRANVAGFEGSATAIAVFLGVGLPLTLFAAPLIVGAFALERPLASVSPLVAAFVGCTLLGCATAEAWLQTDEWRFRDEIGRRDPSADFCRRDRAWPFDSYEFVFNVGRGIHVND